MKRPFDPDTTLTDLNIQFEEVTEAQPMGPLEEVTQKVELDWPERPIQGNLRHRKQKRRPRKGMSKILYLLLAALSWPN